MPLPVNPRLFTFEGYVTIIEDGADAAANAEVEVNDSVTYQIVIDLDRTGYAVDNSGNLIRLFDGVPAGDFPAGLDYFYAGLQSGALIDEVNNGWFNRPSHVAQFHIGADGDPDYPGQVIVGSNDHTIILASETDRVSMWTVGTVVGSAEEAWSNAGRNTSVKCWRLEITSIIDL